MMRAFEIPSQSHEIILFDGICNLCNSSINFIIDHDEENHFKFASLQSDFGQQVLMKYGKNTNEFDSIILLKNDTVYQKSEAVVEITKHLSGYWKYFSILGFIPTFLLNFVYDIVAKNRYHFFGKLEVCRLPTPELKARFL